MAKNQARMQASDIAEAFGLLSRLPVTSGAKRGVQAGWAWPIVGAVVAVMAALIGVIAQWIGLPPGIAAGVALAVLIVLTGALHEDGLADCADGFWGGNNSAKRLAIMRDSTIGTYGTVALVLTLLLRWNLMTILLASGAFFGPLIAAAAVSRVALVAVMYALPPARKGGLSQSAGRPATETMVLAAAMGLLISLIFSGFTAFLAVAVAAVTTFGVTRIAIAKIGGQTGDVLGASQQIAEIGILLGFVLLIT